MGKEHPELTHEEVIALIEELWSRPVFERRLAAAMLLRAHPELVGAENEDF